MSKKSSKTSHVLNLLTNRIGTPAGEQEQILEEISNIETCSEPEIPVSSVPSVTSSTFSSPSEDPISDLIRQELEKNLEAEITAFLPEDFSQKGNHLMLHSTEPSSQSTMEIPNTENIGQEEYVFINIIEEFVKNEYASLMEKMEVCSCRKCKNDVIALALNHLPPKYVVTRKGYLLSKLLAYEKQYKADVLTAVTNACLQVKALPHHME